jgi:hypothetical protein
MRVFAIVLWHDVFDVHAIGEFDQTHLYVAGFRLTQPASCFPVEQDRLRSTRIAIVGEPCLNDNFFAGFVDVGYEPKLIAGRRGVLTSI